MHQEHNIPWKSIASTLYFHRDNPHYTPPRTSLFSRNLPTQHRTLKHFARVFQQTIITFSETERSKYEASFDAPTSGTLFSNELRDRYPQYLNEENQRIEFWIERVKVEGHDKPFYDTRDAGLADVVKILFNDDQVEALLMLAHHPRIPVKTLRHLSWGHHFGFSRVMEAALVGYVLLNLFAAMNLLERGEYLETYQYLRMVDTLTGDMDYPAQQLPHRAFLGSLSKDMKTQLPEVHHDFGALKEYLKTTFTLLYRYDMVIRECGEELDWVDEIEQLLGIMG